MNCIVCNKKLTGRQTKYCSPKCTSKLQYNSTYKNQQKRGHKRKRILVEQMGGKCIVCGYNKNLSVLSFHHEEPSKKKFPLDIRHLSNHSWVKCQKEAKKCILLCLNCHGELHNPEHFYKKQACA